MWCEVLPPRDRKWIEWVHLRVSTRAASPEVQRARKDATVVREETTAGSTTGATLGQNGQFIRCARCFHTRPALSECYTVSQSQTTLPKTPLSVTTWTITEIVVLGMLDHRPSCFKIMKPVEWVLYGSKLWHVVFQMKCYCTLLYNNSVILDLTTTDNCKFDLMQTVD